MHELAQSHPIVSLALSSFENPDTYENLAEFLGVERRAGHRIPYTMTVFYNNYVNYLVVRHIHQYSSCQKPLYYAWNVRQAIDNISKLAFIDYISGGMKLMGEIIIKLFGSSSEKEEDHSEEWVQYCTFGLLRPVGKVPLNKKVTKRADRKMHYQFCEHCVREYLVAHFLFLEFQRKAPTGTSLMTSESDVKTSNDDANVPYTKGVMGHNVREVLRRLPASGYIWRMTFGLMSKQKGTCAMQRQVLMDVIREAKTKTGMPSREITALCVEAIYEAQNAGKLTSVLDSFTLNQTINYSDMQIDVSRILYLISAVGYLVRASGDVYGLHVSSLNLRGNMVAMLADPLNEVSDNNLQVLNLSHNPLRPEGMKRLQRFVVKASLLTHLDLSSCELGNVGVSVLSEYFMCVPLRYLRLSNNDIGDTGLLKMVRNFKYVPTLEWLDVAGNKLTDKSVVVLGTNLVTLPNLRSLDLRNNEIGDAGVNAISASLGHLNQVTNIMLAENRIGEAGANTLAGHMWKTKSLRFINLSLNNIPSAGVMGLRVAAISHGALAVHVGNQRNADHDVSALSESLLIPSSDPDVTELEESFAMSTDLLAGRRESCQRRQSWPRLLSFRRASRRNVATRRVSFV
ncbi:hypothetical protein NP493_218g04034 [Ridgeia piscesae]|uniref:Uncharacterized protein n=1 Tax=Ridgeia piscesae TaxID=27915 RepID=A0AAD9P0L0_RIDPI|nr:hypothetical protein NP493_218g04034 [Ridgeia piscesae]